MAKSFDWTQPVAYDAVRKRQFHMHAKAMLRLLARALELDPGTYDIRSNAGGLAVSGEVTLHGEHIYVQVSQPFGGFNSSVLYASGILFRRCKGRKDYTGSTNNFASLAMLDNVEALATRIERCTGPAYKLNANEVDSGD